MRRGREREDRITNCRKHHSIALKSQYAGGPVEGCAAVKTLLQLHDIPSSISH